MFLVSLHVLLIAEGMGFSPHSVFPYSNGHREDLIGRYVRKWMEDGSVCSEAMSIASKYFHSDCLVAGLYVNEFPFIKNSLTLE